MRNKKFLFSTYLFLVLLVLPSKAQEDCAFTLTRAQRLYEAGNIEQIPQMLAPCIESGFTSEEKQQAQKLIVLCHLFNKNDDEAEKAMLDFLKKYPEYELNPSDQAEFVQLFNSYLTLPIVSIGITGGSNFASLETGKIYGSNKFPGKLSAPGSGYQGGLSLRFYLKDKLDLNIEGFYQQTPLLYQNDSVSGNNILELTETRTSLSFPLSAIYTPIHFKKVNPFLRIGVNFEYLLNSTAEITRQNHYIAKSISDPAISLMENRNNFQVQVFGGIGITYNLKHSFLLFEARYQKGFMSQTKEKVGEESTNQDFWSLFYSIENDYALSHITFNIGFFYKFYKPRKK